MIVIDPTVHAGAVENVFAVPHAPNLLLLGELEQTDGAGAGVFLRLSELGDGEDVPDE